MKDILEKINHKDGMTVPDGYFSDFAARMAESLPVQDWEKPQPKVMPRSVWQKVRPYIYMAAMFMGVWCMMKMFDLMRPESSGLSYFIYEGEISDYQLMEDLYETGFDINAYEESLMDDSVYENPEVPESPEFPLSTI